MKIQVDVERLLGLDKVPRPAVDRLAKEIGISRHQLTHLMDNRAPQICRATLEAVAEYLLGHGLVKRSDLPHELFSISPDSFWRMLGERQRISLFLGVRWYEEQFLDFQVFAGDSVLQSVIVNCLTGVAAEGTTNKPLERHTQQVIDSQLVLCWSSQGTYDDDIRKEATSFFTLHDTGHDDRAIVCLGSISSNAVTDHVVSQAFKDAAAFRSQDEVRLPAERSVPFALLYKRERPQPASCWGATRLSQSDARSEPGIYFEDEQGQWVNAPWTDLQDAALVFYRYNKVSRNLSMILGGFSGRGTRCLAEMIRQRDVGEFWPPVVETDRLAVGAFVVKFQFRKAQAGTSILERPFERRIDTQVVRLPARAVEKRLAKV